MKYSELGLHPDLARAVSEAGFVDCMPVQAATFPHSFAGEDIYAQSQTGTGKTAAFLVSIFQRVMTVDALRHRKSLILAPTRELAAQIEVEAKKLGKYLPISMGAFYGGVSYGPQVDMLKADVQMIIGTPGRIIDLIKQGKMLLKDVGFLVVDEADRMFDMGFIDDLRKLLRYLPTAKERQTFLYSATLGFRVKNLAWEYMDEPKEIVIEAQTVTVELVTQELYHVGLDEKVRVLLGILSREKPNSALVFCNQKFMAEELARRLGINGVECEYIMGDLPQAKRLQVIERLKAGKIRVLVATDVAARGLDVSGLDLVVNYDVPMDPESYVHRIGRTARAGAAGKAVTLACEKFVYGLPAIEKYIETKLPVLPVTEELLVEDKSAGMRFGHARERGRPGDRRGDGHSQRGGRPGSHAGAPTRSHGGQDRRRQEGLPKQERNRRDQPRAGETRADARRPDRGAERNPYAMSQEERMKRYRERYSSGGPQGSQERRPDGRRPDAPRAGAQQARQGQGKPGTRKSDGHRPSRQGQAPGGRQASSAGQASARPASPQAAPARPAATAAKKEKPGKPGILNSLKKLLGLAKD
ncbi:MAG: DEAD/DEAH box helicase [Spirochaetales bacterium]|nr:DEAD/DEAH box helicase [Spirochaetales bacterium]